MGRDYPLKVSGYTVLPLELPPPPSISEPAIHFLYLQPHQPKIPDPDSSRSLFLVNIPITSTESHFKHLFGTQLSAGRVESVRFTDSPNKTTALAPPADNPEQPKSKKRKRETVEELEQELQSIWLPSTWDRETHNPGSNAVVVFVDKASMEASLKAAKKAAKSETKIMWGEGVEDKLPALGSARYENHQRLIYPPVDELKQVVNQYMSVYDRLVQARAREAAEAQVPDEDGFVTVVKGPKRNAARDEELKALAEKQKEKNKGLEDFYRFQNREKRKEKQIQMLKSFEEDKKKLDEMRKRREKIRPE